MKTGLEKKKNSKSADSEVKTHLWNKRRGCLLYLWNIVTDWEQIHSSTIVSVPVHCKFVSETKKKNASLPTQDVQSTFPSTPILVKDMFVWLCVPLCMHLYGNKGLKRKNESSLGQYVQMWENAERTDCQVEQNSCFRSQFNNLPVLVRDNIHKLYQNRLQWERLLQIQVRSVND